MEKQIEEKALFARNFIFGVEDSLVSTVGLLSGVASAGVSKETIFLTGSVLIFVEAFSMAIGSFLSEDSAEEYEKKDQSSHDVLKASFIMFFSYFIAGFVPLAPYYFFDREPAFWVSIVMSFLSLTILGGVSAKIFGTSIFKKSLQMVTLGGTAILAGVLVGKVIGNN